MRSCWRMRRREICIEPKVIAAQARRMLKDPRVRALAVEFGGNWLDFRRFEEIEHGRSRAVSHLHAMICAMRCLRSRFGS